MIRLRAFPLLFLAVLVVAWSPAAVDGQISICWYCVESPFKPDPNDPDNNSEICQGGSVGRAQCAQAGTPEYHLCLPYGPICGGDVIAAADEMAVQSARAGRLLTIDGGHLVLTEGHEVVVMRTCGTEIARLAVSELNVQTNLFAIDPAQRSRYPDGLGATAEPRRGILEE